MFVFNIQIILRDLQPSEENHSIDAVITMKRCVSSEAQCVQFSSELWRILVCVFQGRFCSCVMCSAEQWEI